MVRGNNPSLTLSLAPSVSEPAPTLGLYINIQFSGQRLNITALAVGAEIVQVGPPPEPVRLEIAPLLVTFPNNQVHTSQVQYSISKSP